MARWTGQIKAPTSELYTFTVRTDDGVRLWINNQLLVDKWYNQYGNYWSNTIQLTAGQLYDIRMEMYEWDVGAEAHLYWQYSSLAQRQVVPSSQLFPYASAQPLYEGKVESANCSAVSGWALDRRQVNTALNVNIYVDGSGTPAATVPANLSRSELIACSGENGLHGFSWSVPASLRDGNPHTVQVKIAGTNISLAGSPATVSCTGTSAPPAPTSLTAVTPTPSQIDLTWTYTGSSQNGFVIQRNVDGAGYSDYATVASSVRTFSDVNLPGGHTYCYKVLAYNGTGRSAEPNPTACATLSGGSTGGVPAAPSNLTATFSSSPRKVTLTWTDNSNNEDEFQVLRRYKKPGSSVWSGQTALGRPPANSTSYDDTTRLDAGYTYGYVVRAHNTFGYSNDSNEAQVVIPTGLAPICAAVVTVSGSGGTGSYGYVEGGGTAAKWGAPSAAAAGVDPVSGLNAMFVTDVDNQVIRMVYLDGPAAGKSRLIAGSGTAGYFDSDDGYQARFNNPQGLAVMKNASGVVVSILVADTDNSVIRQVLPPLGDGRWRVRTFSGSGSYGLVDGDAQTSQYGSPMGIAVGPDGRIFVADYGKAAIRLLNSAGYSATWYNQTGRIITFAPAGVEVNGITGEIYVADQYASRIYSVSDGRLVLLAGGSVFGYTNGGGPNAAFDTPQYLAWFDSADGSGLYIADTNNNAIRVLDLKGSYSVTTWAGSPTAGFLDASCGSALFNQPSGVAVGGGELYVVDRSNNSVRKVQ